MDPLHTNHQNEMVTLRARRPPRSSPFAEPSPDSAPSLVAELKQRETIEKALRVPGGIVIDGEHWPPVFKAEKVRSAKAMVPRADDIFICTYPKCGTTWIQHIVHQLLGKTGEYETAEEEEEEGYEDSNEQRREDENENAVDKPCSSKTGGAAAGGAGEEEEEYRAMCFVSPMIERMGAAYADTIRTPRVLKSHFTYQSMPKGGGAKYIYAVRNPKDCLTSYFHHNRNFKIYNFEHGDFDVFFELFMNGEVGFGDYFEHLTSWLEGIRAADERILFLKYEDMMTDLHCAVVQIAEFLGGPAARLIENPTQLAKIVNASTLASMKKNQQRWFPNKQLHRGEFIRKGGSRDWKNQFSYEQSARMDLRFRQRCAGTAAAGWWRAEMAWNDALPPTVCLEASSGGEIAASSSYASSAASSGFYSASPLSFNGSLDLLASPAHSHRLSTSSFSSSYRPRVPSLNPDFEVGSPAGEGPLDRERVDSLQFSIDLGRTEDE